MSIPKHRKAIDKLDARIVRLLNERTRHVLAIGGKYFDVLSGTYWIEDIGSGNVVLHLSSSQRLSTRMNFYSHFWTGFLMADLQNYILSILKKRCEQV